jgi:hypothetical protein
MDFVGAIAMRADESIFEQSVPPRRGLDLDVMDGSALCVHQSGEEIAEGIHFQQIMTDITALE